jgi:hypothetical protein
VSTPEQDQPDAQRAVDAVRAADPAADSTPDLARLRAALTESTGVPLPADELAVRRARRTPRWILAAAAVAGVALVGGGGYAIGTQSDGARQTASEVPAAISLNTQRQAGSATELAPTGDMAASTGRVNPGGSTMAVDKRAAMSTSWFGGHIVFSAEGLSSEGGSHDAWAYDAASVYSAATAARLADALGVKGKPHEDWGWTVGPNDGTAATVTLGPDGTASMSYYDPAKDPWACESKSAPDSIEESTLEESGADGSGDVSTDIGTSGAAACEEVKAPSDAKAKAEAKAVLESIGVDVDTAVVEVLADGQDRAKNVVAYPVVGGQRTDLPWYVTVVADGVSSVNGPVAPLVELGSYDVVSPAQAVERLNDPRFGASGGAIPYAVREGSEPAVDSAAPEQPTVPATVEAGSAIGWPVTDITITKARLGLATHTEPSGSTALVPSYELTGSDGSTWAVIAVVDQQLDTASR